MPRRPSLPSASLRVAGSIVLAAAAVATGLATSGGAPDAAAAPAAALPSDCLRAASVPVAKGSTALRTAPPAAESAPSAGSPDVPLRELQPRRLGPGAWSYFGDARAVSYGPWVYTGWISEKGQVKVGRFKPGSREGAQIVTLGHTGKDDHNNPSLMVTAKGRIVAFFSPHSGRYLPKGGPGHMYYRFTTEPGAINRWTKAKRIPVNARGDLGYTYPNVLSLSPEKTFLAWRGGCWKPTFALREGTTWGPAREIVQGPEGQRPYAKFGAGPAGSGVVHMCYTETAPEKSKTGVHCLEYKDRRFSRANGQRVAGLADLPVNAAQGDEVYRYDRKLGRAWVMNVSDDGHGHPVVLFTVGYGKSVQYFMYGRWTGTAWQVHEIAPAFSDDKQRRTAGAFQTGGMTVDPQDPFTVYLGRVVDHRAKIEKWQSLDQGVTWFRVQRVSPVGGNCFRPYAVAARGGTSVLFVCGTIRYWTDFNTTVQAVTLGPAIPGSRPGPQPKAVTTGTQAAATIPGVATAPADGNATPGAPATTAGP